MLVAEVAAAGKIVAAWDSHLHFHSHLIDKVDVVADVDAVVAVGLYLCSYCSLYCYCYCFQDMDTAVDDCSSLCYCSP